MARMDAERLVDLVLCVCYRDARRGHPLDDGSHPHWPNSGTYSLPPAAGLWHQACSSLRQYYRTELHCPQSDVKNRMQQIKGREGVTETPSAPCVWHMRCQGAREGERGKVSQGRSSVLVAARTSTTW